jgi:hypothetical protein
LTISADFTGTVNLSLASSTSMGPVSFKFSEADIIHFDDGTGVGQAQETYASARTLAASTSENLDLAGVLFDPTGVALNFTTVKAIWIKTDASNINDVVVGGAASNAFVGPFGAASNTIAVRPGGVLMLAAPGPGWAVTPTTADLLKIANGGAGSAVKYKIVIVGI